MPDFLLEINRLQDEENRKVTMQERRLLDSSQASKYATHTNAYTSEDLVQYFVTMKQFLRMRESSSLKITSINSSAKYFQCTLEQSVNCL